MRVASFVTGCVGRASMVRSVSRRAPRSVIAAAWWGEVVASARLKIARQGRPGRLARAMPNSNTALTLWRTRWLSRWQGGPGWSMTPRTMAGVIRSMGRLPMVGNTRLQVSATRPDDGYPTTWSRSFRATDGRPVRTCYRSQLSRRLWRSAGDVRVLPGCQDLPRSVPAGACVSKANGGAPTERVRSLPP